MKQSNKQKSMKQRRSFEKTVTDKPPARLTEKKSQIIIIRNKTGYGNINPADSKEQNCELYIHKSNNLFMNLVLS